MRLIQRTGATLFLSVLLSMTAACPSGGHDPGEGAHSDAGWKASGRLGLKLTVPGNVTISKLDWTIRDAAGKTALDSQHNAPGPIVLANPGVTSIVFEVGGIPAGQGYTLTLEGADSKSDSCAGTSAPFDIVAGRTTTTYVTVTCIVAPDADVSPTPVTTGSVFVDAGVAVQVLDAELVICPAITAFSGAPLDTTVGGQPVAMTTVAAGAVASFAWTQDPVIGTFNDATAASPTFACSQPGVTVLTLVVSLPGSTACEGQPGTTMSTTVVCEPAANGSN